LFRKIASHELLRISYLDLHEVRAWHGFRMYLDEVELEERISPTKVCCIDVSRTYWILLQLKDGCLAVSSRRFLICSPSSYLIIRTRMQCRRFGPWWFLGIRITSLILWRGRCSSAVTGASPLYFGAQWSSFQHSDHLLEWYV
jgi:hypothetical protein